MEIHQSLSDAIPMVMKAITTSVSSLPQVRSLQELQSALKCLEAWTPFLSGKSVHQLVFPNSALICIISDLTPLLPLLITLLTPSSGPLPDDDVFIPASDALQEIMSKSSLSSGSGTKTLTEPILIWCEQWGGTIVTNTLSSKSRMCSTLSFEWNGMAGLTYQPDHQRAQWTQFPTRFVNFSLL
jgi:hypothetical protein